jgi:hypothetical protein
MIGSPQMQCTTTKFNLINQAVSQTIELRHITSQNMDSQSYPRSTKVATKNGSLVILSFEFILQMQAFTIFPEAKIKAVVLGSLIRMMTAAKRCRRRVRSKV